MSDLLRDALTPLVEASWQAAAAALLLMAITTIAGRRLSPAWRCALWMLVFVRLALPALPASPVAFANLRATARDALVSPATTEVVTFGVIPSDDRPKASVA